MKKYIFTAALISFAMLLTVNVFAGEPSRGIVSSSKAIDLSGGEIEADTCDFSMQIPPEWTEYLRAYQEYLPVDSRMMEQIEFYFFPLDKTSKPIRLVSINIYDKRFFMENATGWKHLFESENYVFTVYAVDEKLESNLKADMILFNYYKEKFTDINYLKGLMKFPEAENTVENSVIIDSVILKDVVTFNSKNVPYIPVRKSCETLGYNVSWSAEKESITISKPGFALDLGVGEDNRSYNIYLLDDTYYVSAFFFTSALACGIEVDERGNVYITK
ncbi:MAG: copper amine oxidase N-terminal domain-containing protein [Clostridiales bacterium]|jgi:hypothetical protein|nr:copper amine oxidase N-terminal domain-containing protein [Clostridiales bacterium]